MADFETKLRWLSERGNPVGAEELIERIEAEMAGDPLVVVAKRREGTAMTKTQQSPRTNRPSRYPAWAAFVAILAVAGLYFAFAGDDSQVADNPPPPTTVGPDAETMTDLEIIEAGVAAVYSGAAERAVELFELPDRNDAGIRVEAAYQAAIGGRLTLNCSGGAGGIFQCNTPYQNAMTDAIGEVDSPGDSVLVVVEDGEITAFAFPVHTDLLAGMGTFLAMEGRFDNYEHCVGDTGALFPESCAIIQTENLDAWVEWREHFEAATLVEFALESWYGGDCVSARHVRALDALACSLFVLEPLNQTIKYESIMGAEVSLNGCEEVTVTDHDPPIFVLSCEVHYSNAMYTAVGKPPSVTVRGFEVHHEGASVHDAGDENAWYATDYPEDTELRESFRMFAESGELGVDYSAADCANARTSECANLMMDNLDEWAAWYEINS